MQPKINVIHTVTARGSVFENDLFPVSLFDIGFQQCHDFLVSHNPLPSVRASITASHALTQSVQLKICFGTGTIRAAVASLFTASQHNRFSLMVSAHLNVFAIEIKK
jgi:hypothetical protein